MNRSKPSAEPFLPRTLSLGALRAAAAGCRGCDLYAHATQTVFGEGRRGAALMLVGEVPGDVEDREGRPFVGPAGKLLRRAMTEAGLSDDDVYVTNAVKHFKFLQRGKRRIHVTPKRIEIRACEPWLEAEIRVVRPRLVVALGAIAAQALLGSTFRLTRHRGELLSSPLAPRVMATIHPSAILRAPDDDARHAELTRFIADLKAAAASIYAHEHHRTRRAFVGDENAKGSTTPR